MTVCVPQDTEFFHLLFIIVLWRAGYIIFRWEVALLKLNEAIGQRLKNLLNERNWAYNKLETEGGVSRSTVRKIAEAMHNTVKVETLYEITQTLGITLQEFFDDPIFDQVSD